MKQTLLAILLIGLLIGAPTSAHAANLAAGPSTTNNDDSCDIGLYPAATLLLPYFEVETSTRGVDTFFTITNVTHLPQIAHVTVWTDWAFPVLTFNLFLTGYDVQAISMYDVIVNGSEETIGGTSASAPSWQGIWARIQSGRGGNLGNADPVLYAEPASAFNDITLGVEDLRRAVDG